MQLLYQITPTVVYIKLSNLYHQILEHLLQLEVDPKLYDAVNRGVILGVAILSFFILFPGEPFEMKLKDNHDTDKHTLKKQESQKTNVFEKNGKMKEHTPQNKHKSEKVDEGNQGHVTLMMNIGFYALLFIGGLFILDRSYGISFKSVLKHYLPREAAVVGF